MCELIFLPFVIIVSCVIVFSFKICYHYSIKNAKRNKRKRLVKHGEWKTVYAWIPFQFRRYGIVELESVWLDYYQKRLIFQEGDCCSGYYEWEYRLADKRNNIKISGTISGDRNGQFNNNRTQS